MKKSLILLIIIALWLLSCGLPQPFDFGNESINPPLQIKSFSSNNTITLVIQSFNTEDNSKNILGFNIYFDGTEVQNNIINNFIFLENDRRSPTVNASANKNVVTNIVRFNSLTYTNFTTLSYVASKEIEYSKSYFFIVKTVSEISKDIRSVVKDDYFGVIKESIEIQKYSVAVPVNTTFSFSNMIISNDGASLFPLGGTLLLSRGYQEDWNSIKHATSFENGYTNFFSPIKKNHIYLLYHDKHYAKLQVSDVVGSDIVINFSYQGIENELEI